MNQTCLLVIPAAFLLAPSVALAGAEPDCHVGAYRLSDGSVIDLAPTDGPELRYRQFDGTTGVLHAVADGAWTSTLGWIDRPFTVLADDAVAAMREARRLAGSRAGRVGYQGGSQGGWVAPLAATRAPVDFVVVSFGLAVSPVEEDQQEVELEMRLAGHGPDAIAKALELSRAAEAVIMSGFTDGFARFEALRAKYRSEPWYKDLRGNMTRTILPYGEQALRVMGPAYRFGTPWRYDAMPVLRAVKAPQLWILGEDDLDAPSAETSRRIRALAAQGRPITLAMFPHTEHGMTEYEVSPSGERISTRFAAGYFTMMRDFMRDGRLGEAYGTSVITRPARR